MRIGPVEVPRYAEHMFQASPLRNFMLIDSNNAQPSPIRKSIDGCSSNGQASPDPSVTEDSPSEPVPAQGTTRTRNDARPSSTEQVGRMTLEEEEFLNSIKGVQADNLLDLPRITRAKLYNFFIAKPDSLRILTDKHGELKDFPAHEKEDFELLRTLTRTYGDERWWTIMVDDLRCPECVLLIRAKRKDSKSKYQTAWLNIKRKIRRLCHCEDNSHDFVCRHERRDTNKVKRFFSSLGAQNASRMVNIELRTNSDGPIDIDILASAAYNMEKYFKNLQKLKIRFHFDEGVPVDPQQVKGIVCSLMKLEELLPMKGRLIVQGFEGHEECRTAWKKKSRKFWQ